MFIKVRVIAGSKKEAFTPDEREGYFTASVREKAERNMANHRVIELVALHYAVPPEKVRIISGHHHPIKLLSVDVG